MYKSFWGEELSKFSPLKKNEPLCKKTNYWCPILRCVLPIIPCQSWVSWPRLRQRHMPALTQDLPEKMDRLFPFCSSPTPQLTVAARGQEVGVKGESRTFPSLPCPSRGDKAAPPCPSGGHRSTSGTNSNKWILGKIRYTVVGDLLALRSRKSRLKKFACPEDKGPYCTFLATPLVSE